MHLATADGTCIIHSTFYIVYDIITSAYLLPYLLVQKPVTSPTEWFSWDPGHITTNQSTLMSCNWMLMTVTSQMQHRQLHCDPHQPHCQIVPTDQTCWTWCPSPFRWWQHSYLAKRCSDETTREMKHKGIAVLAVSYCIMVTDQYFGTSDSDTKHCSVCCQQDLMY